MKCIKDKCEYCKEDDFKMSCYRCTLDDSLFRKDSNVNCPIDTVTKNEVDYLNRLKELRKKIDKNQTDMVLEFIEDFKKLHPTELEEVFTSGYCYWFAKILHGRFIGEIVYNAVDNHFAFQEVFSDKIYDVTGRIDGYFESWSSYSRKDKLEADRIMRDCILKV